MPIITISLKEAALLDNTDAIDDTMAEGSDVPNIAVELEVIDLDTYEPQFCTCIVEQLQTPQFGIVFALLAIRQHWCRDSLSVESLVPPNAAKYAAQEACRRYQCAYYAHACLACDQA